MVTFVAALGGLLFGFDLAIISGAVPFIKPYFNLTDLQLGWAAGSLLVGAALGSAIAGKITDRFGRKKILFAAALLFIAISLGTGLATNFTEFIIWRILGGIAVGGVSIISPMYISEISPFKIRGRLISFYQLSIVVGILISFITNMLLLDIGEDNWRWMFISGVIPSVLFFVLLFFVPETPRFLYKKGLKKEALRVLTEIGGKENAELEIEQIKKSFQEKISTSFRELAASSLRKVLKVGFGLAVLVQFCGINTIMEYAPIIFESTGSNIETAFFSTIIIGCVNLIFTFVSIWLIEKVGRRILYIIGSAGLTSILVGIVVMSSLGLFKGDVALGLILGFIAFFAACIGPVFWTLVAEIFPNRVRGIAMSVPVVTQWLAAAIIVASFPWLLRQMGTPFTFGLLAVCSAFMLWFTYKFVPETKGKTLEEIEGLWK